MSLFPRLSNKGALITCTLFVKYSITTPWKVSTDDCVSITILNCLTLHSAVTRSVVASITHSASPWEITRPLNYFFHSTWNHFLKLCRNSSSPDWPLDWLATSNIIFWHVFRFVVVPWLFYWLRTRKETTSPFPSIIHAENWNNCFYLIFLQ